MLCKEPKRRSSDVWDPTDTLPGLPADEIAAPETSKKTEKICKEKYKDAVLAHVQNVLQYQNKSG